MAARTPSPLQNLGHAMAGYLAAAVLALFTLVSVASARRLYAGVPAPASDTTLGEASRSVLPSVVLTVAALIIVGLLRAWPGIGVVREPVRLQMTRLARTLMVLVPAIMVSQALFYLAAGHWAVLRGPGGPTIDVAQTADQLTQTWSLPGVTAAVVVSAAAGLTEEICGLAIPVWLLVRYKLLDITRTSHVVAFAVATVVLRIAYHAYLGPSAMAFAPWAALTAVFYLRTQRIVPIVLAHTLYDVTSFLMDPVDLPGDWSEFALQAAIPLLPAALWIRHDHRRRVAASRPQPSRAL